MAMRAGVLADRLFVHSQIPLSKTDSTDIPLMWNYLMDPMSAAPAAWAPPAAPGPFQYSKLPRVPGAAQQNDRSKQECYYPVCARRRRRRGATPRNAAILGHISRISTRSTRSWTMPRRRHCIMGFVKVHKTPRAPPPLPPLAPGQTAYSPLPPPPSPSPPPPVPAASTRDCIIASAAMNLATQPGGDCSVCNAATGQPSGCALFCSDCAITFNNYLAACAGNFAALNYGAVVAFGEQSWPPVHPSTQDSDVSFTSVRAAAVRRRLLQTSSGIVVGVSVQAVSDIHAAAISIALASFPTVDEITALQAPGRMPQLKRSIAQVAQPGVPKLQLQGVACSASRPSEHTRPEEAPLAL